VTAIRARQRKREGERERVEDSEKPMVRGSCVPLGALRKSIENRQEETSKPADGTTAEYRRKNQAAKSDAGTSLNIAFAFVISASRHLVAAKRETAP